MLELLYGALAVDPDHRPDIRVFADDGHYACEPVATELTDRGLVLVHQLRRNAVLWVPWTEPSTGRPGRPRKDAGRFDRANLGELPDEGKRLYYKPVQKLLRVVFRFRSSVSHLAQGLSSQRTSLA